MNIKLSKKTYIILAAAVLAAGIAAALCVVLTQKPVAALYGLNDQQKTALLGLKVFKDENGKAKFRFVEFDASKPLEAQLKRRVDLLFAFDSAQLKKCAQPMLDSTSKKLGIERKYLGAYTETVRDSAGLSKANRVVKLPIANDMLCFASDSEFANQFGMVQFNSLGDVERYLQRCKDYVRNPFVFAGGEDGFVLDLAGVFSESVSGTESYGKAMRLCFEYCAGQNRDARELAQMLCSDEEAPLYEAVERLREWYKKGYFTRDNFSMKYGDVYGFMKMNAAPLVALSLSARRSAVRDTVKRYVSFYVPSEHYNARALLAPTLCVLCRTKNKTALDAASRLALTEMQEVFNIQSGLAPVLASCKTADLQADDVRFWTAASATALAGLSSDGFTDKAFAAEVSERIKQIIVN